ncbi:MAG: sigma-70 family RNA polymerase sigma factor [Planctomycetes bacterium]|nr:sigma-70 family RNA polymerase sigma factor [Planctomycetota bacterium]
MAQPLHTSWALIQCAAAGAGPERDTFARRYAPVIRDYLRARWRLPADHERVEDALQEVFVECFKADGVLDRADPAYASGFRAYLFGVVAKVALVSERRFRRRSDRPAEDAVDLDGIQSDEESLSRAFDKGWAELVVREAIELLRERSCGDPVRTERFTVLEQRFLRDLTPAQIGEQTGHTPERTYQLLRRAKSDFRSAFLDVLRAYDPSAEKHELERTGREILQLIS